VSLRTPGFYCCYGADTPFRAGIAASIIKTRRRELPEGRRGRQGRRRTRRSSRGERGLAALAQQQFGKR
jgi:hypothetical protein